MLTLDTLYLFKAYRINKSRAHSPEEIPDIFFFETKQELNSFVILFNGHHHQVVVVVVVVGSFCSFPVVMPMLQNQQLD
jgi:hypothetical protein